MQNENENEENLIEYKGRLKITDDAKFLEALSGAPDVQMYEKVQVYAKKILEKSAKDIPMKDKLVIINMALFKAFSSFNSDGGAKFLTYFTSKLRGEVSDYNSKRESMLNKVYASVNEERDSFVYQMNKETQQNDLDKITEDTPETILFAEDMYKRRISAFRMAHSTLPLYSQFILNEIVSSKKSLEVIAIQEGVNSDEIKFLRNSALSLILTGVLRSNHLDEEEKDEIRIEHGLSL